MRIGYARVSTCEQSLDLQIDALEQAGCETIFKDHGVSGVAPDRPGLSQALKVVQDGDTLVVWRLDRMARSMRDLIDTVDTLHARKVGFQSLCEHIDIDSAFGELILHVLSSVVHFERRLIVERTRAGIEAARARGVKFGRPHVLSGKELREALYLQNLGVRPIAIAKQMGIGRSTVYRYLSLGSSGSVNRKKL